MLTDFTEKSILVIITLLKIHISEIDTGTHEYLNIRLLQKYIETGEIYYRIAVLRDRLQHNQL